MFPMQSLSKNILIATFQLSSAVPLNLGQSQNGVLGNGLMFSTLSQTNFMVRATSNLSSANVLTLSQTSPGFYVSEVQVF